MRYFAIAMLLGVAACGSGEQAVVTDGIEVRSFSGLFGGSSYVMTPDGVVTVTQWAEGGAEPQVSQLQSSASFGQVTAVARDAIAAVGPVSGEACLDYGTDLVEVRQGGRVTDSVSVACPDDDVERAQRLVRAAMLDGAE